MVSESRRPHVVIAVVNLPAERDRRVIRECTALESAGFRVTVICPRGREQYDRLRGTRDTAVRTFRQPFAGTGVVSFAVEFAWSFLCVAWHLAVLVTTQRVIAVQVCNPPDAFWPLALLLRATGRPWVFDHHDLCPELYECKTPSPRPLVSRTLVALERLSVRCASAVVSTNGSYRDIAVRRAGCRPEKVAIVRNAPTMAEVGGPAEETDAGAERRGGPDGHTRTIAYVGVLNPQDRVDIAIHTARLLLDLRGPTGWEMVIAGDGECLADLRRLADTLELGGVVRFTGWLEAPEVDQLLRRSTVAIQPDPPTQMAELSTMAKTVEYLARGVPVVAASLLETRYSAGAAGVYVPTGTAEEYAKAIDQLLDDAPALAAMRQAGLTRFRTTLAWEHQAEVYLGVWRRLLPAAVDWPDATA